MTDILFYVLAATTIDEQQHFVCRLTEKVLAQGKHIYIHTGSRSHAEQLDRQLWAFRHTAFVPHSLVDEQRPVSQSPVHIGWQDAPTEQHDVLINLNDQLPSFFGRFDRLVEVVIQQDDVLGHTRDHFRFLRDRGYPITHQDMRLRT
ncbi:MULTISPECIES: DNA polymerase III subunit chi [unclassified Oceanobacter]|jgi:DNA polymerase-3 subunit chi|uniref:DNA polymerase III subunit chi n=1 Tax=unclassified Oceanobacter TaxID=2620260 RepID=UPI0026E385BE|nr:MULTISPECIES: DNA polymerase III subunit chi [unclassified Oceanobacter]MDO6681231.1 DNA polymerase III subunit chi [Oceanobacter sp. 5_MG-2023]MDP2504206.1 DNA polymerase III subunit chi [Oceanobacter sp. 3_MG-2023]MDP2546645.1 DNA polymerase III subunit chi [Oceanobacter sp. 4_MG-2023]MDP2608615.1 DNA polymerase III subunit chi [Oceanobacter sp. 1_MG-2023]MDP2611623.1 DNA polymerase III subunit chi [Oceanobacter sp. 2_MG-2023]